MSDRIKAARRTSGRSRSFDDRHHHGNSPFRSIYGAVGSPAGPLKHAARTNGLPTEVTSTKLTRMDSLARVARTARAFVKADASFRDAVRAAAKDGASYREISKASSGLVSHEGARKIANVRRIRRVR